MKFLYEMRPGFIHTRGKRDSDHCCCMLYKFTHFLAAEDNKFWTFSVQMKLLLHHLILLLFFLLVLLPYFLILLFFFTTLYDHTLFSCHYYSISGDTLLDKVTGYVWMAGFQIQNGKLSRSSLGTTWPPIPVCEAIESKTNNLPPYTDNLRFM
jgi:hypothetical protein